MPKNWKEIDRGKSQDDVIRELTNQGVEVLAPAYDRLKSFEMRPTFTFSNATSTANPYTFGNAPARMVMRRKLVFGDKPSRRARTRKLLTRGQI